MQQTAQQAAQQALSITAVVTALAPAFAVGAGIQHLNELLDAAFSSSWFKDSGSKKLWIGVASAVFALVATLALHLRIVALLSPAGAGNEAIDVIVTTLIISTGTEGINSIVKFLGYAKEQQKATAAQQKEKADGALGTVNREPAK